MEVVEVIHEVACMTSSRYNKWRFDDDATISVAYANKFAEFLLDLHYDGIDFEDSGCMFDSIDKLGAVELEWHNPHRSAVLNLGCSDDGPHSNPNGGYWYYYNNKHLSKNDSCDELENTPEFRQKIKKMIEEIKVDDISI